MKSLTIIFTCITAIALIIFFLKDNEGHVCRWQHCPYKGIKEAEYKSAVLKYTDSPDGSDAVSIDMLHLKYPSLDYDQLEDKLFEGMKK